SKLLNGKNPTAQIQSSKTYRQSDGLLLESQFTFGRDAGHRKDKPLKRNTKSTNSNVRLSTSTND
ncbi:MAG: hypothetical protein J6Q84_07415, partial [Kiritimatiellae bacterium]|nr:hypothetical protein [Kiritimatiellia bacterium]